MHITSVEEYGLRCALQLAKAYGTGHVPASAISEKEGISLEYVSKLMHLFRKAGIVQAVRGTQGGFGLVKSPGEVSLKEIFGALVTSKADAKDFCKSHTGQRPECVHLGDCSIRPVWSMITGYFESVLDQLTLEDLIGKEEQTRKQIGDVASRRAKELVETFRKNGQTKESGP